MLDILKKKDKSQKGKEVKTKMNNSERKLKKLLSQKQSIESELEKLKIYKDKVKVLLPFEKIELLEKELELLKIKERIALKKIEDKRKEKGSSQDLDKICVQIRKAIEEKKEEIFEVRKIGKSIHLDYNNSTLDNDPRTEIKEQLKEKEKHKRVVELINKRLKILKDLENNKKNILNNVKNINKGYNNNRLINITDEQMRRIKELRRNHVRESGTDYQAQLEIINAELEEIRAELISRNEYTI